MTIEPPVEMRCPHCSASLGPSPDAGWTTLTCSAMPGSEPVTIARGCLFGPAHRRLQAEQRAQFQALVSDPDLLHQHLTDPTQATDQALPPDDRVPYESCEIWVGTREEPEMVHACGRPRLPSERSIVDRLLRRPPPHPWDDFRVQPP